MARRRILLAPFATMRKINPPAIRSGTLEDDHRAFNVDSPVLRKHPRRRFEAKPQRRLGAARAGHREFPDDPEGTEGAPGYEGEKLSVDLGPITEA